MSIIESLLHFIYKKLKTMNWILCLFFKCDMKYIDRSGGDIWGWNNFKCTRCGKKEDSL